MKKAEIMRVGVLVICLALLSSEAIFQAARGAEKYPTKPIEILSPFTPGGSSDYMARLIAEVGQKYLGQPMVVVNKPGAGGSLAVGEVLSSSPDGYKMVMISNFFLSTTVKTQKVPFDPNNVTPLACFFEYKNAFIVKGDSPWKSLKDMVEYGRKNPKKLKIGHNGRGTTQHLPLVLIFGKSGAEISDIPYKGGPEKLAAVLGGHIDGASEAYTAIQDHVKAGRVRVLVFYSDRRYSVPSDVPCTLELGFAEASKLMTDVGMFVHKDTPEGIKKTLIDACKKIYDDPRFKKGLESFGEEPRYGDPEFMKQSIQSAKDIGVPLIKQLGLYVE
jgi:tripartite-type tricarboxylate transporter receptor subunit TctC